MALSGIKVLEIAGLAPAPYAGKITLLCFIHHVVPTELLLSLSLFCVQE